MSWNSNVVDVKVVIFSFSLLVILFRYPLINFAEGGKSLAVCEYDNELPRLLKGRWFSLSCEWLVI